MLKSEQVQDMKARLNALPLAERLQLLAKLEERMAQRDLARPEANDQLSAPERRMWTLVKMDKVPHLYHVPVLLKLTSALSMPRLQAALDALSNQNEILRSYFIETDGSPTRRTLNAMSVAIATVALDDNLPEQLLLNANHALYDFYTQPFEMASAPLWRIAIVQGKSEYYLACCFHHMIMDAWSLGLLLQQLNRYYNAGTETAQPATTGGTTSKVNYAKELAYWEQRLQGKSWRVDLPVDFSRSQKSKGQGRNLLATLPTELHAELSQFAQTAQHSVNHVMLALFQLLLSRYSGQNDILLGIPVAGREQSAAHTAIGLFVNTCLHACHVNYAHTLHEHLQSTRQQFLADLTHAHVPYDELVIHLYQKRLCQQGATFNILYNYVEVDQAPLTLGTASAKTMTCLLPVSKFDLSLHIFHESTTSRLVLEYSTSLFAEETIQQFMQHYLLLLSTLKKHEQVTLREWVAVLN